MMWKTRFVASRLLRPVRLFGWLRHAGMWVLVKYFCMIGSVHIWHLMIFAIFKRQGTSSASFDLPNMIPIES